MNEVLESLIVLVGVIILIVVIMAVAAGVFIFAANGLMTEMGITDHLIPWTANSIFYAWLFLSSVGGISLFNKSKK